jgi:Putative adhesin
MAEHGSSTPILTAARRPAAAAAAAVLPLGLILAMALAAGLGAAGRLAAEPQARSFRQAFPVTPGVSLRLGNLAGRVELVSGAGNQVVIDAEVHAELAGAGETQRVLQEMKWVRAQDGKGRDEWVLSYPVERYRSYFYPQPREGSDSGFWSLFDNSSSSTTYRGERVRVYTGRRSSAPTLYADLRIALPTTSDVALRNLVGKVHGGGLEGTLALDTGSSDIRLESYAGQLRLDTGSGDIVIGVSRGETAIDTGSGDVVVRQLVGNASIDTGSGDVRIEKVAVGTLKLHTGSGDVTVRDGAAGKLTADTGSGEVRVIGVELEELVADTGSGDVEVASSLDHARRLTAKTGSGDVRVYAGPAASFDVTADQSSGDLRVNYADAVLRHGHHRDKVVGARRGDGRTIIRIETGSGDCVIGPRKH